MQKTISRNLKVLILLIALLNLAEGVLLYLFPDNLAPILWPTRVGTYGARFYAAVFLSVTLGGFLIWRENDWTRVRIVFLPAVLFTSLAFIAALISFNQPGSFEATRAVSWIFLVLYAGAALAGIVVYWMYELKK